MRGGLIGLVVRGAGCRVGLGGLVGEMVGWSVSS